MEQFSHLRFIQTLTGKAKFSGGGGSNPTTVKNKANRHSHSSILRASTSKIQSDWLNDFSKRKELDLAPLDKNIVPLYIQINPELLNDVSFDLLKFGIEIISEENDGFIVGASLDNMRSLGEKIDAFLNESHGSAKVADLWKIVEGNREIWKPEHILSEDLLSKWDKIIEDENYQLEVSIAFDQPKGKKPDITKKGGEARLEKYRQRLVERDEKMMERQSNFELFISHYGKLNSSYVELEDSFSCEIEISGKGLKDLVFNYPFVFEIIEKEIIGGMDSVAESITLEEVEIVPPDQDDPVIGIIDSGIMEQHPYIASAINPSFSKSYLKNDLSTNDKVKGGGHGTKVAGAILFPKGISTLNTSYKLPCFIRNLRVLNADNLLEDRYPAELMERIIDENKDCKIFNLCINSRAPYRIKHMSAWAATIDTIIHSKNKLFFISAGNISYQKITQYLSENKDYPNYLSEPFCRLSNPAQSSFSIVVGSINHTDFEDDYWESLGSYNEVSAFSRIGTGIWGSIKPDVVEYGGGLVVSKNGLNSVKANQITSPELIRSTFHGGSAFGKDIPGTSFATPKVTFIASQLEKLYKDENINLIRALIIQGSRLPNEFFVSPTNESVRYYGYGIPSLDRSIKNSKSRITYYITDRLKAEEGQIYSLKIPEVIRSQENEFDILIEVTLAYTAKVRRTRQRTKSYLGTWLDWSSSYLDETLLSFKERTFKEISNNKPSQNQTSKGGSVIKWKIREQNNWGQVPDLNRNNSTVQKDWVILKAFDLPEELSFIIKGHKGWDSTYDEVPFAFVVSVEAVYSDVEIYEPIRIENEAEVSIET